MTDLWYYAEGGQQRGPMPLSDLIPLLSRIADPRYVMVWRHGFDDWKPVEEVREIAQQLFRPPPLKPGSASIKAIRQPVVAEEDAAAFKDVKPALSGIAGWLGLLAFGQVIGILRLIASVGQYTQSISDDIWKRFPTAIWGEMAMNAALIGLCIYTSVLFFKHSRKFPSFFIIQMICAIMLPIMDLIWVASIFSVSLNRPISEFLTIEPKDGGQVIAGAIGAAIWIAYVLRSRRVANTFTK
jgi:hypothetical protein